MLLFEFAELQTLNLQPCSFGDLRSEVKRSTSEQNGHKKKNQMLYGKNFADESSKYCKKKKWF